MTLLDHKTFHISEKVLKDLETLKKEGHVVAVATGRDMDSEFSKAYKKQLQPDAIVHSNGQKVTVGEKNRSLEKFYDSKIIDIRTEKKVSGGDLNCGRSTRNKNLNTEDLRKYRGVKISKGQRRIRKQKYFYQPNDLVKYDGKVYTVKGTQNEGKYIALKEIKKVPKVELLIPYVFKKGLNWSYRLC